MVAVCARAAEMAIQSGNFPDGSTANGGGAIFSQCPPSVVRAIAPLRPASQQIVSETAAPASQSSCEGLACKIQVPPALLERWMVPPFPARQRIEPDGAFSNAAFSPAAFKVENSSRFRPFTGRSAADFAVVLSPTPLGAASACFCRAGALLATAPAALPVGEPVGAASAVTTG